MIDVTFQLFASLIIYPFPPFNSCCSVLAARFCKYNKFNKPANPSMFYLFKSVMAYFFFLRPAVEGKQRTGQVRPSFLFTDAWQIFDLNK